MKSPLFCRYLAFLLMLFMSLVLPLDHAIAVGTVKKLEGEGSVAQGKRVQAGKSLKSGNKSILEVQLEDSGTLKMGSATEVFLREKGDGLDLKNGVIKLRSDRSGFTRKTMLFQTAEANLKTKGTALVAYRAGKYMKVTCIEGEVTVSLKAVLGEFVTLRPGQMLILHPSDRRIPGVCDVHLDTLVATSSLLKKNVKIERAISRQEKMIGHRLSHSTHLIRGGHHHHHDHAQRHHQELGKKLPSPHEVSCLEIQEKLSQLKGSVASHEKLNIMKKNLSTCSAKESIQPCLSKPSL